jgi:hypothetical protein
MQLLNHKSIKSQEDRERGKMVLMKTKWAILILILAGFIAYGNTLKNGLFWDDDEFIKRNEFVRSFAQWPNWFTKPLTAGAGINSNYYRPLLMASFTIDYHLWGLWPAGYHFENILWHTMAAILLFIFLHALFSEKDGPLRQRTVLNMAFATSLLWLIHPAHVEAVAYANSRGDSMATVFILLSLILWIKSKVRGSAIAFTLALLSKEFAIVTPGLILLTDYLKDGPLRQRTVLPKLSKFLPHIIIASAYVFLRLTALNFQNTLNFYGADLTKTDQSQPFARYATSLPVRLMTFMKVLPIYAGILVWPNNLHMERTVNIPTTILDPGILSSLAVILAAAGFFGWALIFSLRKSAGTSEPRNRALVTHGRRPWEQVSVVWGALGWFFISIIPVSGLIPISQILAEHFLYLPSIGFFLLINWLLLSTVNLIPISPRFRLVIFYSLITPISLILLAKTIRQNRVWRDPITFYEYTLTHAQPTARVYNNLAMAYADTKNHDKAIENYQKSIALGDVYPNPHYNLGNTFVETGNTEKAEQEYKNALIVDPNFHYATLRLGQIYINRGKIDDAKKLVCPIYPTQPLCL